MLLVEGPNAALLRNEAPKTMTDMVFKPEFRHAWKAQVFSSQAKRRSKCRTFSSGRWLSVSTKCFGTDVKAGFRVALHGSDRSRTL